MSQGQRRTVWDWVCEYLNVPTQIQILREELLAFVPADWSSYNCGGRGAGGEGNMCIYIYIYIYTLSFQIFHHCLWVAKGQPFRDTAGDITALGEKPAVSSWTFSERWRVNKGSALWRSCSTGEWFHSSSSMGTEIEIGCLRDGLCLERM